MSEQTDEMNCEEYDALLEVAEAAVALFRPPHRHLARTMNKREHHDFRRLYDSLCAPNCPVEIGEQLT